MKVQRNKRIKPISATIASVKVADDTIHVDSTQLFQRIVCTVKIDQELEDCFTYELATVPLSIFDDAGLMRKTKKSALYRVFDDVKEGSINESGTKYAFKMEDLRYILYVLLFSSIITSSTSLLHYSSTLLL